MVDRKTTSVDRLYSEGRSYPRGQTRDPGARERIPVEPAFETGNMRNGVFNRNTVQDPEDTHEPNYDNDYSGWVRGSRSGEPSMSGETGEGKPGYDRGSSWRLGREKSLNWNSGSDRGEFVKPGSEAEFEKRRK